MKTDPRLHSNLVPNRYTREFEYEKEKKVNVRMTEELHKDMKRILLEIDENWQSTLGELLIFFVLSHQDCLPKRIREANLSEIQSVENDSELKALARERILDFIEKRPTREPF